MLRKLYALCFLAFLPISANAISTVSVANSNCSGELTASTLDGASFACVGNLTLDGGFITSDSLISISASGDLFLDNLTFTAPDVWFYNLLGTLTVGSGVVVNASSTITLTAYNIFIAEGAKLNVTAVPEPSTNAMMLAGVLGLISFRRTA